MITVEISAKMSNGERQLELFLDLMSIMEGEYTRNSSNNIRIEVSNRDEADRICEFINECTVLTAWIEVS